MHSYNVIRNCAAIASHLTYWGAELGAPQECTHYVRDCGIVASERQHEARLYSLDDFTRSYVQAALDYTDADTSDDSDQTPLSDTYGKADIAPETLARMALDCARFQADNAAALEACYGQLGPYPSKGRGAPTPELAGYHFWMARNGHGVGFCDGDYLDPHADALQDAAGEYGTVDLYLGDDGVIYAMGCE